VLYLLQGHAWPLLIFSGQYWWLIRLAQSASLRLQERFPVHGCEESFHAKTLDPLKTYGQAQIERYRQ
jgi:hypothetical protein